MTYLIIWPRIVTWQRASSMKWIRAHANHQQEMGTLGEQTVTHPTNCLLHMVNWNHVNRNTVWTWFSQSHINIWYSSNFNLKLIKQNGRNHPASLPTSFRTSKSIHLKHSIQNPNNPSCCNHFINPLKLRFTLIPKNQLHPQQCSLKKIIKITSKNQKDHEIQQKESIKHREIQQKQIH